MTLHLAEIANMATPGAHATLVDDKAGWHVLKALVIPPNIALVPLPGAQQDLV